MFVIQSGNCFLTGNPFSDTGVPDLSNDQAQARVFDTQDEAQSLLPSLAPYAAGAAFYIQGSASKTVRVTRIVVTYISTSTTVAYHETKVQKYSALSGGTIVADNNWAKLDSADGNPSAVVSHVTAVNTTQTAVGGPHANEKGLAQSSTAAAASVVQRHEFLFGDKNAKAGMLHGTSEFLGVVFDAATCAYDYCIEWTEE
jgi:hypothetical protein